MQKSNFKNLNYNIKNLLSNTVNAYILYSFIIRIVAYYKILLRLKLILLYNIKHNTGNPSIKRVSKND